MKKRVLAAAIACAIAISGGTALWAQDQAQPSCDKCAKNTQKVAQQGKCICPDCAAGKKDPACTCGCNSGKQCDLKGCAGSAKKEKSQQKPCCDKEKVEKKKTDS